MSRRVKRSSRNPRLVHCWASIGETTLVEHFLFAELCVTKTCVLSTQKTPDMSREDLRHKANVVPILENGKK